MTQVFIYERARISMPEPFVSGNGWVGFKYPLPTHPGHEPALIGQSAHTLPEPPGLLITDVDSTLIDEEVIDQLAKIAGVYPEVAAITERAMRGELDFSSSLRQRVRLLEGLPVEALDEVGQDLHIRPGARELVEWVHRFGGKVGAISGGFSPIVAGLAAELAIDSFKANDLEVRQGRLTGQVSGEIVTAQSKEDFLRALQTTQRGPTIALGDGANDLLMLGAADLGVTVLAKPALAKSASAHLDVPNLEAVIGLAGFSAK